MRLEDIITYMFLILIFLSLIYGVVEKITNYVDDIKIKKVSNEKKVQVNNVNANICYCDNLDSVNDRSKSNIHQSAVNSNKKTSLNHKNTILNENIKLDKNIFEFDIIKQYKSINHHEKIDMSFYCERLNSLSVIRLYSIFTVKNDKNATNIYGGYLKGFNRDLLSKDKLVQEFSPKPEENALPIIMIGDNAVNFETIAGRPEKPNIDASTNTGRQVLNELSIAKIKNIQPNLNLLILIDDPLFDVIRVNDGAIYCCVGDVKQFPGGYRWVIAGWRENENKDNITKQLKEETVNNDISTNDSRNKNMLN